MAGKPSYLDRQASDDRRYPGIERQLRCCRVTDWICCVSKFHDLVASLDLPWTRRECLAFHLTSWRTLYTGNFYVWQRRTYRTANETPKMFHAEVGLSPNARVCLCASVRNSPGEARSDTSLGVWASTSRTQPTTANSPQQLSSKVVSTHATPGHPTR